MTTPASTTELLAQYARGPDLIAAAVQGLSREQLLARPVAGKWTMLELLAHLADAEQVYADRMKRVIASHRPLLIGFNENEYIAKLNCAGRDAAEELALIRVTRSQMLRILQSIPAEAWDRQGVHNEAGLISLRQFAQSMIDRVNYRLKFAAEKRAKLGA